MSPSGESQPRLRKKVRVARGPVSMAPALPTRDAVYAGCQSQQIVKLSRGDLSALWRIEAGAFLPFSLKSDLLLMLAPTGAARGVDPAGRTVWSLERKGQGWGPWRDRLISVDKDEIAIANPASGKVEDRIRAPIGAFKEGALCGDVLLFQDESAERYRAFDLARREFLWERPLFAEIKQTYGVSESLPILSIVEGGPGRFIGSRGGSLFGFNLQDGRVLWYAPVAVPYYYADVHEGRVYVWSYTHDPPPNFNRLVCLDEATGATVYDHSLQGLGGRFATLQRAWRAAFGGKHVAFTTESGLVALFQLSDGALVWSYEHKATAYRPAIDGDRLYVTTGDGYLLAFEGNF